MPPHTRSLGFLKRRVEQQALIGHLSEDVIAGAVMIVLTEVMSLPDKDS